MGNKVVVHCLVKNEENFIWYAINSVLPMVDKIMVWDTGSTDKTIEIIKSIESPKIELIEKGEVDSFGHTALRQEMLDVTDKKKYRWLLILDGDEVWREAELVEMINAANKFEPSAVIVKTINFVGDINHKMPESEGKYEIAGHKGHLNIRLIDLQLPKLTVQNPHGGQTYTTNGVALQNLPPKQLYFSEKISYFHATHLERSSLDNLTLKRSFKRKYEIGDSVEKKDLPTIFFSAHPKNVPDVDGKMNLITWLRCLLETVPKRVKRVIFPSKKTGYI